MKQRISSLDEFINEGKQIGFLYHYTYLIHAIQIIDENVMKMGELHQSISFTRDKNFHKRSFIFRKEGRDVRIVIDGDKLSQKYKVQPYNYFSGWGNNSKLTAKAGGVGEDQSEETVLSDIHDIKKYIISIDLPSPDMYSGSITVRGKESNDWIKALGGDEPYKQKYVDIEDELDNVNDVKDYFESKGYKVNFFK